MFGTLKQKIIFGGCIWALAVTLAPAFTYFEEDKHLFSCD